MSPWGKLFLALCELNMHGSFRVGTENLIYSLVMALAPSVSGERQRIYSHLQFLVGNSEP